MEDPIQFTNPSQNTKKRSLQNGHIQNSNYYKIRAIARDLRPHFIQVLKTPDFRNCVAAQEIRDQMKRMMDLYKEMMAETISITRCMNLPETQTALSGENPQTGNLKLPEDPKSDDARPEGTFVVGGSASGWNFVTYPCGETEYYGRTKEMFRAQNVVVTDDLPDRE